MEAEKVLNTLGLPAAARLLTQGNLFSQDQEPPVRAELFGPAQLQSHARLLAQTQHLDPHRARERLLPRLNQNQRVIQQSYRVAADAVAAGRQVAPAAEWLLDNFYLILEQVDIAREHFPAGYSRKLPHLASGVLRGYPRVYEIAMELVAHTDGRIDMENLSSFVGAYQTVEPLKLGELWAIPIMLRLALLENLRRVALRIALARRDRDLALIWSKRFLDTVRARPRHLIMDTADFVRKSPALTRPFIAELAANLQGQHPGLSLVLDWIEQQLAENGQSLEQVQHAESQYQAADQASIGNSITTLRSLSTNDWRAFVEAQSVTEAALKRDPLAVYAEMDFRTRDAYRHVVEDLAERSGRLEQEVAAAAAGLAAERRAQGQANRRQQHVGFFLIDDGLPELEKSLGYRPPIHRRLARYLGRRALAVYFIALILLAALFAAAILVPFIGARPYRAVVLPLAAVLTLLIATRPALALLHWLATLIAPPRIMPRLDFSKGIPDEHRTIVVVPTLLSGPRAVPDLLDALEVRYLSNRGPNLLLALLTDFPDAPAENLEEDQALLDAAAAGIDTLNKRYAPDGPGIFYLLHRPRKWNEGEQAWMGRERKRGKLADFNHLLRTGETGAFDKIIGDLTQLKTVRYVITLDTDTQLPAETAWKLVGSMAHTLNRPVINPQTHCVEKGYGVLQPRVAISLAGAGQSLFAGLFSGEVGIDPYSRQVSNVYHDLFARGQFIGKGIYDARAFEASVGSRFPDNAILSHDLIEGAFAGCGFVNDVELIESHPSRYLADINRRHRWVRGDWQISPWLLSRIPTSGGGRCRNPLQRLSLWLIFDNLRRSLVPAGLLALLLVAWFAGGVSAGYATTCLLGVWFLPDVTRTIFAATRKRPRSRWDLHLRQTLARELRPYLIEALQLVFLPYEAAVNLGAITRVIWRKLVTGRKLLEWQTSHDADRSATTSYLAVYYEMAMAPAAGIVFGLLLAWRRSDALAAAGPFLVFWLLAPAVAWFISLPRARPSTGLTENDRLFLLRLARRTWAYFEQFVAEERLWLPPDNFQETPEPVVAERTSPTNIAAGLIGSLAAHDLGFISGLDLLERTEHTFATLDRLPRYRGHFFNWYDTKTGKTLHPAYVSTVDSGNLAGQLLTLRAGLLEQVGLPILPRGWAQGLRDALSILDEEAGRARQNISDAPARPDADAIRSVLAEVSNQDHAATATLAGAQTFLAMLEARWPALEAAAAPNVETAWWLAATRRQCASLRKELDQLAPWAAPELATAVAGLPASGGAEELRKITQGLAEIPTLHRVAELHGLVAAELKDFSTGPQTADVLHRLADALACGSHAAAERIKRLEDAAQRATEFADLDLEFLFDARRKLLAIGYDFDGHHIDPGHYDLLASEARLTSFVGIAQGKLPQEHWFLLGRQPAAGAGPLSLMSWSGSMFEYLMPNMIMPSYPGTLLDQACLGAVRRQIRYGQARGVPWGFSESCFNQVDGQMTYQYRAFGVPELGLKRGLADDLVVAPYASAMALMTLPRLACQNLRAMAADGFVGRYGLYEAVDYTPSRVPDGQVAAKVRCFMAHHSGMTLLSLAYVLQDRPMQRRFTADPELRAALLLLQERVPPARGVVHQSAPLTHALRDGPGGKPEQPVRRFTDPQTQAPEVHLLSNGRFQTVVTAAGGGYSRWNGLALTRWREDSTRDHWGLFLYLHDVDRKQTWSAMCQPTCQKADNYEAIFAQGRAEFRTLRNRIEAFTQIAVSAEDDIEVRRTTLTNLSNRSRTIEFTSFAEAVLLDPRAEAAHPAFANLFVQTELLVDRSAILCTRRAREARQAPPWMFHAMLLHGHDRPAPASFEADRARFLGRGRSAANPAALDTPGALSNTAGAVLDPAVAARRRVHLRPGQSAVIDTVTGAADSRDKALGLVDRCQDRRLTDRVFEVAWTRSQVMLHQLQATEADADTFAQLAGSIIYANARYRASPSVLAQNRKGQSGLWAYGVSGDLPLVLLRITESNGIALVRKALQAHAYWRQKGLQTELFIWTDAFAGYRQTLLSEVTGLIGSGAEAKMLDQPGGVFVRSTDQLPEEDRVLLQAVARLVLTDRGGTLAEQAGKLRRTDIFMPALVPSRKSAGALPHEFQTPERGLVLFNGIGGFTPDGREYIITLRDRQTTPAPWVNVLANPNFGAIISESGCGYTWAQNAHEFRLTPWSNDAVADPASEAVYIRDEETGSYWSPTAQPARGPTPYVCRHGLGYSAFEHAQEGVYSEMMVYVAHDAPVRIASVTLRNNSDRRRRLSLTGYCELVLGESRQRSAMHLTARTDPQTGAILASNPFAADFADRVVFFQASEPDRTVTASRTEFLGRHGSPGSPAALGRERLSNRTGAGLDPCAAIQCYLEIPPGQQRTVVFTLGAAASEGEARGLIYRFGGVAGARQALEAVWEHWKSTLGGVSVETPDPAVNFLTNHWLLYQTIACRMWGRSGFYQSGGAFGFRDQLQDSMALVHDCPWLIRPHLLLAASRQFREGDVQHWWHPPTARGVRTHFSDDLLWLPAAVARYVLATGDTGVLDEQVAFLESPRLREDEESRYELPTISGDRGSLYDHCVRAIRQGVRLGQHGLPLMGCGDWNDGMNRVGIEGRGESVWLGFFLHHVLGEFAKLAEMRDDRALAEECHGWRANLSRDLDAHAWDGQWYLRAYFDDGSAMGSTHNSECRIDSLPQSWAVISGAADPTRARVAVASVVEQLVDDKHRLIRLFDPPFDKSPADPGYIKGYVPGVRENGGQYTHAAVWAVIAAAQLKQTELAWRLFGYINPLRHADTAERVALYKVDPYVVAADVYTADGHEGRGGWTWYTGSAAWMYRLLVEHLLGLSRHVDTLRLAPVVPPDWKEFTIHYRFHGTVYHIHMAVMGPETSQVRSVAVDGVTQADQAIHLVDDHADHQVRVELG